MLKDTSGPCAMPHRSSTFFLTVSESRDLCTDKRIWSFTSGGRVMNISSFELEYYNFKSLYCLLCPYSLDSNWLCIFSWKLCMLTQQLWRTRGDKVSLGVYLKLTTFPEGPEPLNDSALFSSTIKVTVKGPFAGIHLALSTGSNVLVDHDQFSRLNVHIC